MSDKKFLDDRFYVEKLGESTTFKQCVEIGELNVDTFYGDSLFDFWYGSIYYMRDQALEHIHRTDPDPVRRLRKYINAARQRQKMAYSRAEQVYLENAEHKFWQYGLYDSQSIGGPRLAGSVTLIPPSFYPKYQPSIFQKIRICYLKFWFYVKEKWRYLFVEHPWNNARFQDAISAITENRNYVENTPEEIDRLAHLSPEEIKKAVYPESYMWFTLIVIVSEYYQRKGLGQKMFQYVLDQIPRDKPVFRSADGLSSSEGEVRVILDSSERGKALYEKLGFSIANKDYKTIQRDGIDITSIPFVITLD